MSEQRELQKIECLVGGLHSWRGLKRIVSVYQAWHGHVRVGMLVPTQARMGLLEAASATRRLQKVGWRVDEERVLEISVQRDDNRCTAGILIEQLQAVEGVTYPNAKRDVIWAEKLQDFAPIFLERSRSVSG